MWRTDPDACCSARKVEPLQRALGGQSGVDQPVFGVATAPVGRRPPVVHADLLRGVTKINPIAAWSDSDVAAYGAATTTCLPTRWPTAATAPSVAGPAPCRWPRVRTTVPGGGQGASKTECGLHLGGEPTP